MVRFFKVLIAFTLLCQPAILMASDDKVKVVLHVNDKYKIGHLGKSVKNIRAEMGIDIDIRVVINGKAVTRLLKSNKSSAKIVESVLQQNVPIGLCHNAVANNRVNKSLLIEGLDVLETDGNVTVLNYQRQGYFYIKM